MSEVLNPPLAIKNFPDFLLTCKLLLHGDENGVWGRSHVGSQRVDLCFGGFKADTIVYNKIRLAIKQSGLGRLID